MSFLQIVYPVDIAGKACGIIGFVVICQRGEDRLAGGYFIYNAAVFRIQPVDDAVRSAEDQRAVVPKHIGVRRLRISACVRGSIYHAGAERGMPKDTVRFKAVCNNALIRRGDVGSAAVNQRFGCRGKVIAGIVRLVYDLTVCCVYGHDCVAVRNKQGVFIYNGGGRASEAYILVLVCPKLFARRLIKRRKRIPVRAYDQPVAVQHELRCGAFALASVVRPNDIAAVFNIYGGNAGGAARINISAVRAYAGACVQRGAKRNLYLPDLFAVLRIKAIKIAFAVLRYDLAVFKQQVVFNGIYGLKFPKRFACLCVYAIDAASARPVVVRSGNVKPAVVVNRLAEQNGRRSAHPAV